jgi:hypothetical protein
MLSQSRATRRPLWLLLASIILTATACGGGSTVPVVEGVIDRETFIETYVDIRAETVQRAEIALPDEERDRILALHGVDAESLLSFVEAYGRELDFMNEIWAEVDRRLEARPAGPPPTPLDAS